MAANFGALGGIAEWAKNSRLGKIALGGAVIGTGANFADDILTSVKNAAAPFTKPGGWLQNLFENAKQNEMFSNTVTGVRNAFVGIFEFAKVIVDVVTGKIPIGKIFSGELNASEAFSSTYGREADAAALAGMDGGPGSGDPSKSNTMNLSAEQMAALGLTGAGIVGAGWKAYSNNKAYQAQFTGVSQETTPPKAGTPTTGQPRTVASAMQEAMDDVNAMDAEGKKPSGTPDIHNKGGAGHGKSALIRNTIIGLGAMTIPGLIAAPHANAEEAPADGNIPAPADNPELALAQAEAVQVEAQAQEVATVEAQADAGFDLAGEAGHFAHVAGHGLQNGLIGLAASPEALWDMADSWTGGALWGDHETSSTTDGLQSAAPIPMPEIRNDFDAAVHGGAELATWLIPVGGVLKAAGAGAKVVNGVRAFEATENVVNTATIGSTVATVGAVASDAYLGTHFMTAANGQIVPTNPMAVFNPNAGDAGITGPQANNNEAWKFAM